jgi:hypothetical protein
VAFGTGTALGTRPDTFFPPPPVARLIMAEAARDYHLFDLWLPVASICCFLVIACQSVFFFVFFFLLDRPTA